MKINTLLSLFLLFVAINGHSSSLCLDLFSNNTVQPKVDINSKLETIYNSPFISGDTGIYKQELQRANSSHISSFRSGIKNEINFLNKMHHNGVGVQVLKPLSGRFQADLLLNLKYIVELKYLYTERFINNNTTHFQKILIQSLNKADLQIRESHKIISQSIKEVEGLIVLNINAKTLLMNKIPSFENLVKKIVLKKLQHKVKDKTLNGIVINIEYNHQVKHLQFYKSTQKSGHITDHNDEIAGLLLLQN